MNLNELFQKMITYYMGDAKRIQHFIKVHSFAKLIGEQERMDPIQLEILEAAAYVHDIGIKPAEEKHGNCSGKLQEQEGPAAAEAMLRELHAEEELIERVCYLVGHHHTYKSIDGLDYQILVEADFLVNLFEDEAVESTIYHTYDKIFKTETGKKICREMFLVNTATEIR